jgi:Fe-Mn family superoxide dismutase
VGELELPALFNADLPMKHGGKAVLTIDVWEHAYYVDYRNERAKFVAGFMEKMNRPFAEKNYR